MWWKIIRHEVPAFVKFIVTWLPDTEPNDQEQYAVYPNFQWFWTQMFTYGDIFPLKSLRFRVWPAPSRNNIPESLGCVFFFLLETFKNSSTSKSLAQALLSGSGSKHFRMNALASADMDSGISGWTLNIPTWSGFKSRMSLLSIDPLSLPARFPLPCPLFLSLPSVVPGIKHVLNLPVFCLQVTWNALPVDYRQHTECFSNVLKDVDRVTSWRHSHYKVLRQSFKDWGLTH